MHGFVKLPGDAISTAGLPDLIVVVPDTGLVNRARQWADGLHAPVATAEKRRADHSQSADVIELISAVEGRPALIVDDPIISAGTLCMLPACWSSVVQREARIVGLPGNRGARRPIQHVDMIDSVEPHVDVVS